jgi:hypothetical protein
LHETPVAQVEFLTDPAGVLLCISNRPAVQKSVGILYSRRLQKFGVSRTYLI